MWSKLNTLDDSSDRLCVPNKTEGVNLKTFNMITGTNESKSLMNIYEYLYIFICMKHSVHDLVNTCEDE